MSTFSKYCFSMAIVDELGQFTVQTVYGHGLGHILSEMPLFLFLSVLDLFFFSDIF